MNRFLIIVLLSAAAIPRFAATQTQQPAHEQYVSPWRTPWTYAEASRWSDLDPDYATCNTGKQQSPIDIHNAQKAALPPLQFESKLGPLRYVTNNGHTIRVNYQPGNQNFLVADGKSYELVQFHFHHPSEEYIEGKPREMEAHLMYKAGDGKVAGVTVFVRPGRANPTARSVWQQMPRTEGQQEVAGIEINPGELLPPDTAAYYMYLGSVTAPPCTEGVTWFVLKTPIEMSTEQIQAFAKIYPNNVRPLQPLNGRVVKQSR